MNRAEKTAGWTAGEGRWAGGGEERSRQGEAREAPQVRAPSLAWVTEVQRNPGEGRTHGIQSLSTPRPLSGTALGNNTQEPRTLKNQTKPTGTVLLKPQPPPHPGDDGFQRAVCASFLPVLTAGSHPGPLRFAWALFSPLESLPPKPPMTFRVT